MISDFQTNESAPNITLTDVESGNLDVEMMQKSNSRSQGRTKKEIYMFKNIARITNNALRIRETILHEHMPYKLCLGEELF